MRARIVITLGRPNRRRLEQVARKSRDAGFRLRVQIVVLYARGWGCNRIAVALGVAPATAVRVAHRFLEQGEEGLHDGRAGNGIGKVDPDSLAALAELVRSGPLDLGWSRPTWTRELLVEALARKTGLRVSVSTVARMLDRLGARWGMAAPIVLCPWPDRRRRRRLAAIQRVLKELPVGEIAFYEDEVDIHLNPKIGRDWMLRGQQKLVLTPGKNTKRYLAGALAVDRSELVWVESDSKTTDLFLRLLNRLKLLHPRARRIHLVLDNYAIHSSAKARTYLHHRNGLFVLHFLPPYSPQHNHIERFWRDLHAEVTRNHRCRTIHDLMARVDAFLRRANRRLQQASSRPLGSPTRRAAA